MKFRFWSWFWLHYWRLRRSVQRTWHLRHGKVIYFGGPIGALKASWRWRKV